MRYQGILPDLFREGQGVVAEGTLEAGGRFDADTVLAKHDERYMPKEVVDALKKTGRWQESERRSRRRQDAMIAELGHYALVLALALGLIQSVVPIDRRAHARCRADAAGRVRPRSRNSRSSRCRSPR